MIAGKPGSYKSVLALNMLLFWANQGLEILHFSADSDEQTVLRRVSSIITGDDAEDVEKAFIANDAARYANSLGPVEYVRFVYRQMEMEAIYNQVECFESMYGAYPNIIFFDNLIDFVERPDDWGGMLLFTKDVDALARETKSHVVILHHAKRREDQDMGKAPADWEIQGKVTQIPRMVLTMGAVQDNVRIACVKNTNGPQDPQAYNPVRFRVRNSLQMIDTMTEYQNGLRCAGT
jgi:KaiC/GvpD/RAD55 family RecA-like ATPase